MKWYAAVVKKYPQLYKFLKFKIYARLRSRRRAEVFNEVYERNSWDGDYSVSGPGSTLDSTENLRAHMPIILRELKAESLLDIPCGDFQWMRHVDLGVVKYIGGDIVLPLIEKNRAEFGDRGEFQHLDLLRDRLPHTDVLLCRDCFVHLSLREIRIALRNICRAAPEFLLTTTFPGQSVNEDTVTPDWRPLNLSLAPFNFPKPLHLVRDYAESQGSHRGKYLGVWAMADIPV